jgi:predicted unusual protein kinase regulating ubiquinone biosynthesis (AarF/ABC1/UbiB family)
MSMAMSPENLKVYKNILGLLWRHGNREILDSIGLGKLVSDPDDEAGDADGLADDLERLGPTYIKIGQVLSTQLDILPPEYMEAMARLQDNVEPLPFPEIQPLIEHGIGAPIKSVFREFDTNPLGAASLGQVHRAELLDGRVVAVKVQRPDAPEQIAKDFDALHHVAHTLDGMTEQRYNLEAMLDHTRHLIESELDYTHEAANLMTMRRLMSDEDTVIVPAAVRSLCSEKVLVMDYLDGEKLSELSPRRLDEIDGPGLAQTMFKKYLDHILVEGFYHADPHPGNVLIDAEGRILLLDLGMVGRLSPRFRERLTQLVLAIVDGRGDDVAETAIGIGNPQDGYDRDAFTRDISNLVLESYNRSIDGLRIGRIVLNIADICGQHHVQIPPELSTIGKALLHLDELGQTLDPTFNPAEHVRQHTLPILWQDFWKALSPTAFFGEVFEVKRLVQILPTRLTMILEQLARDDHGFKIDAIDEDRLIQGIEKVANRITYGLIVAALFIAGAMVAGIEDMPMEIAGLTILAWLMFLVGTLGIIFILGGMAIFNHKK